LRQGLAGSSAATGAVAAATNTGRFVPPTPAELAEHFPQLQILELLGQGGMGAVYKARQPHLDRMVALKILPPEAGGDPAFAERFAREARALAKLSHPGIVAIHDFGRTGDMYYLVMEYIDGSDLRHVIHDHKLQPAEALAIVPQLCDALQYAHDEGIVHRDIKPENVLIDRKGRVKVADFGLAKMLDPATGTDRLTGTRQVMGTWRYMAPEQLDNPLAVDHRADIYSLGVVFYELLTGELPIGRFAVPSQKAKIDARLDDVVLKALENEPDRRYQHASDVREQIESIEATAGQRGEKDPKVASGSTSAPLVPGGFIGLVNSALAGNADAIARLKQLISWSMGTLSTILLFAWIFEVIPGNVGLFLWLAAASCTFANEVSKPVKPSPQLEAALAIHDPKAREAALSPIVLEAAENGDGALTAQALESLRSGSVRDQVARQAAIMLHEAGESKYALAVAQMISDRDERDDVLRKLAE
jgi:serine/threonine protein kinase